MHNIWCRFFAKYLVHNRYKIFCADSLQNIWCIIFGAQPPGGGALAKLGAGDGAGPLLQPGQVEYDDD